jgi:hypothetical protein
MTPLRWGIGALRAILAGCLVVSGLPPAFAAELQVLDRLQIDGSTVSPFGGVGRLPLEEGEQNRSDRADLADPEDEHPLDQVGPDAFDLGFQLRQPLFKSFLDNLQDGLLGPIIDLVEGLNQDVSPFVGQAFAENLGDSNDRHAALLMVVRLYHVDTAGASSPDAVIGEQPHASAGDGHAAGGPER